MDWIAVLVSMQSTIIYSGEHMIMHAFIVIVLSTRLDCEQYTDIIPV